MNQDDEINEPSDGENERSLAWICLVCFASRLNVRTSLGHSMTHPTMNWDVFYGSA